MITFCFSLHIHFWFLLSSIRSIDICRKNFNSIQWYSSGYVFSIPRPQDQITQIPPTPTEAFLENYSSPLINTETLNPIRLWSSQPPGCQQITRSFFHEDNLYSSAPKTGSIYINIEYTRIMLIDWPGTVRSWPEWTRLRVLPFRSGRG